MTQRRIRKPDTILCLAESDLLFQTNYLAITVTSSRGLRLRIASVPRLFLKSRLGVGMVLPILAVAVKASGEFPMTVHVSLWVSSS
jgi:hypothetical protein